MAFDPDQVFCILDYETFSEADLRKVGAFEYAVHPSTEILCTAWRIGTRATLRQAPIMSFADPYVDGMKFPGLIGALTNPNIILVAQNALFEQMITRHVRGRRLANHTLQNLPIERWHCTAASAAALALPRSLEGAAQALRLPIQKDMSGHRLMLKLSKPRKPTKNNHATRHTDPGEMQRLVEYCKTDIGTTTELFLRCPPLSDAERQIWILDQVINQRGFRVDRILVKRVLEMVAEETKTLNAETMELTGGSLTSATKVAQVRAWLENEQGLFLPNLQKQTVDDAIKDGMATGDAKRMLEIRQAIGKTSTKKYVAFKQRSRHDGRVRDILKYHAASTGRWGGVGVQPQNLVRATIKDTDTAADICRTGDLELVRMIYGDPMEVFSSCLRSVIVAPKGHVLDVADYNAIEVRVCFWLAQHKEGLKAFHEGRDLYKEQAVDVFGVKLASVTTDQRWLGKTLVLGAQFGLGPVKFVSSCAKQGREVSKALGERAIKAYREKHKPVVRYWDLISKAALAAVENPGKRYTVLGNVTWYVRGSYLWCKLPSGRRLAYYGPTVQYDTTPWGTKAPVLYHWGVNSLTKKWERQKTYGGKLVENVVQATARDVMASAMIRIEEAGPWQLVLTVHDELVGERAEESHGGFKQFLELMAEVPPWADGLPISVEGWTGRRYRK